MNMKATPTDDVEDHCGPLSITHLWVVDTEAAITLSCHRCGAVWNPGEPLRSFALYAGQLQLNLSRLAAAVDEHIDAKHDQCDQLLQAMVETGHRKNS